jgi:hypothetical protein
MSHLNLVHKHLIALFLSFLALGVAAVESSSLYGHTAYSVGLSRFEAIPEENGMRLEWDVETEIGTAGYTIKRGETGVFDYLIDPQTDGELFILAEGSPTQSYSYSYIDESAVSGTTYTYQLFEVTAGSSEQLQDEVTVIFQIEATNTPVIFSGNSGNGQENNNSSSTPAVTQTAVTSASVTTSTPAPVTAAPASTPTASAPLPENTGTGSTAAEPNGVLQSPDAAALSQDAYPGDSPDPQEQSSSGSDSDLANESSNSLPAAVEPGETDPPANENTVNAYPGAINAMEASNEEEADLLTSNPTPIVIRGALPETQDNPYPPQPQGEDGSQASRNADSSRILLWLAFIVALIIFTASVVGSIFLYSNRRSV